MVFLESVVSFGNHSHSISQIPLVFGTLAEHKLCPLGTVVAHFLGKEEVVSSILTGGSKVREKSRTYAGVAQPGRASGS